MLKEEKEWHLIASMYRHNEWKYRYNHLIDRSPSYKAAPDCFRLALNGPDFDDRAHFERAHGRAAVGRDQLHHAAAQNGRHQPDTGAAASRPGALLPIRLILFATAAHQRSSFFVPVCRCFLFCFVFYFFLLAYPEYTFTPTWIHWRWHLCIGIKSAVAPLCSLWLVFQMNPEKKPSDTNQIFGKAQPNPIRDYLKTMQLECTKFPRTIGPSWVPCRGKFCFSLIAFTPALYLTLLFC